jgi:hypothetical protein
MKIIIFGGPTISEKEVKAILADAQYMPPAKQADVISVVQNENPDVIGIVDSIIHSNLSVWHKEILFALDNGIRVYGAGSMGAIRAAELFHYGMRGVGQVFEFYKNGRIEDDDEVLVKFEKKNGQYIRLSEPMVNLRITFDLAKQKKVINASTHKLLVDAAKSLHYSQRSLDNVYQRAVEKGLHQNFIKDMRCFTVEYAVDITKQDSLEMLKEISCLSPCDITHDKKNTSSYSMLFAPLYERDRRVRCHDVEFPIYYISNYLCLYHPDAETLNYTGLNREISLFLAEMLQIHVDIKDIENEITRFRKKHNLENDIEFDEWKQKNDLPPKDFETLFEKQAILRKMHYWFLTSRKQLIKNTTYLLEELKLDNKYVEWKEKLGMREKIVQESEPEFKEAYLKEDFYNLFRDYLENHKMPWNINIKEAAKEMGMRRNDIKIEFTKDMLFRKKMSALAAELFQ